MVQTSIQSALDQGIPGGIARSAPTGIDSVFATEAMPAGVVAVQATATVDSDNRSAELPSGGAGIPLGILVHSHSEAALADTDGVVYGANRVASVMRQGEIFVEVEDAVTAGGSVFYRHTANGPLTQLGAIRSDADTANAAQLAGARFKSSASAGGLAIVEVNIP